MPVHVTSCGQSGTCVFAQTVLKHLQGRGNAALVLLLRYIPPLLWGKSGHLQTVLYGKMGRVNTPTPCGVRKFLPMQDGATATFDLFEALGDHSTGGKARSRCRTSVILRSVGRQH